MTTTASLSRPDLSVEPGSSVHLHVTVCNDGGVVDRFHVVPLGIPEEWVTSDPPELSLFPGAEGVLEVTVAPPRRADLLPGPRPFGLQVVSAEDPDGSDVEEGVLDVLPFSELSAELQPRTSRARGRARGRHTLAVDNRGNVAVEVQIGGGDRDGLLEVTADPPCLVVAPGAAAFVGVAVRARTGFWRGPDRTSPVVVDVAPPGGPATTVDATFVQRARMPRWLPKALLAALLLLVLVVVLWQVVLRPAVEDEARAAAAEQLGPVLDRLADQEQDVAALQAGAPPRGGGAAPSTGPAPAPAPVASAPTAATGPTGPTAPTDGVEGGGTVGDQLGAPASTRLELTAGRQSAATDFGEQVFSLTDLLLSNPRGHAGVLTVLRDDDVLMQSDLANFRDLDYHFVTPLVFAPGQRLRASVECDEPAGACEAAVLVSGAVRRPAKDGA